MRRWIAIAAALIVALGASGASAQGAKVVDVDDDFFTPDELKIKKNKRINFNWVGVGEHNVYKKSGPGRQFDSGYYQVPGVNFSKKFKKPGKYVLGCTLHPEMLMDLKVRRPR